MGKAVRAIIIENGRILVMHRQKAGSQYYTLVGGKINDTESMEQALVREVHEETGLQVTAAQLIYYEQHPEPYNEQYIYYCEVAPHSAEIKVMEWSEEGQMNKHQANVHTPMWTAVSSFKSLPFRTPQLQAAILTALKKGFPKEPIKL